MSPAQNLGTVRRPEIKRDLLNSHDLLIGKIDDLVGDYSKDTLLGSNRAFKRGDEQKPSGIFPGTYLTNPTPGSPLRSIITFTKDNDVIIMDSIQGGIKGMVNPFGQTHGTWKPARKGGIVATVLNFGYPAEGKPGSVSRGDMRATFDPQGKTVTGTITTRQFDLQQDPLTPSIPAIATYSFTGQRLIPLGV